MMSKKPNSANRSGGELESLAEDLLGVDLRESLADVEPFDVGDFDLEDAPPEPAETEPAAPVPESSAEASFPALSEESSPEDSAAAARQIVSVDVDDIDDDFGSSVFDEDDEPVWEDTRSRRPVEAPVAHAREGAVPVSAPPQELSVADDSVIQAAEPEESDEVETDAGTEPEEDTYWDALAGWDWEEEGEETPKSTGRKPRERGRRGPASAAERPMRKTSRLREDDDFGAGIDEELEGEEPGKERVAGPPQHRAVSAAEEEEERPSRRRGRRRRRRGEREKADEPLSSERADTPDSVDNETEDEWVLEADEGDDGFGAGLEIGEGPPPDERRPRSRRRRRRRSEERATTLSPASEEKGRRADEGGRKGAPDQREPAGPEDVEAADASARKYRNIPTWEEAISLLVRPTVRRSSSEKSSEGQRGGRGRSRSRRGGRGGRRSGA